MTSVAGIRRSLPIRRTLSAGIGLSVIASLVSVGWTAALAVTLAAIVEHRSATPGLIALVALAVVRLTFGLLADRNLVAASTDVASDARSGLIERIARGRTGPIGADVQLLGPTVDDLRPWVGSYLPARAVASVVPLTIAIAILVIDPLSALVVAFAGPMLIALLILIGRSTRERADRRMRELEWLRHLSLDLVRGIPTLRIFGRLDDGADAIRTSSRRFTSATMDLLRTAFQTSLVIEWAATAATALVAVEVALRLVDGDLSFGRALLVLMLVPEFFAPLRKLSVEYHAGRMGEIAASRIDAALDDQSNDGRPNDVPSNIRPTRVATTAITSSAPPTIALHHIGVRFDDERPRLHDIDLHIGSGETIAITGPSGSGKSTLASLVIGTLTPTSGSVTVDGTAISDLDPDGWRSRISIVSQRPILLDDTIAANIGLADPVADRRSIELVAARAHLIDVIADLPLGLDTVIGPNGARLSGGQRQRIAIARAMLRDAPLVILDEFTAHLDADTEREVIAEMAAHLEGRTAIVIAHRAATLTLADRVVHLVDGRLDRDRPDDGGRR